MTDYIKCPKCRGVTWLEYEGKDVVLRCLCGLNHYVERHIDGVVVMKAAVPPSEVRIPQIGSKIHRCLMAIAAAMPKDTSTLEVAQYTGLNNKETAALLVILMARGLVQRVSERRGVAGGSLWSLTVTAANRLN